jgi:DNA-binding CsgD family transcriptional regulator
MPTQLFRRSWPLVLVVLGIALFYGQEIYTDDEPITLGHVLGDLVEVSLLVGSAMAALFVFRRLRAQEEESRLVRHDLEVIRAEGEQWRRAMAGHLEGLSQGIRDQFEAWGLTAAEQEVGRLLLKGLSHKEIARVRQTSEATIRQQAAALYHKSGLSGRAALSAFFLEDLLSQPTIRPGHPASDLLAS